MSINECLNIGVNTCNKRVFSSIKEYDCYDYEY